ncbi:16661_t:CDS:1, partial [Funneliformis geosporum]
MNTSTSTYSNLFDININDILDDELNLNFDESNPILTNEDTNIENEFLAFFDD